MTERLRRPLAPVQFLLAGVVLLLAWEATGLDRSLAAWSGTATGFALRDAWWLRVVMHEGGRALAWLLALVLCLGVWWPFGMLRRLELRARLQLAVTPLAAVLAVTLLKRASGASCPWDMSDHGGLAHPVSHWLAYLTSDGGGGHCFPAGHASAGFAFVGGWFVHRRLDPRQARRWLLGAIVAGALFGIAQQLRGAHYMSHTLWTLWVCASVAWAVDRLFQHRSLKESLA